MPYQDASIAFRLILQDSEGAELDDIDPFYFGTSALTVAPLSVLGVPTVTPEAYASAKPSGVCGDGTDDGPAFAAACAEINSAGGGLLDLYPGRTYWVGGQTLHNPGVGIDGTGSGVWYYYPDYPYIIDINSCTKPVGVRMNGATIRCLPSAKYGAFETDGTPHGTPGTYAAYGGNGASSPYFAMIRVTGCSNTVKIEGAGELDGNIKSCTIGGPWAPGGDGIQLPMTGIEIYDNTGVVTVDVALKTHHHGLDGAIGNGPGLLNTTEPVVIKGLECRNNARQGLSLVGGNGWEFQDCKFIGTGRDLGATMVYSSPGAGVDLEAEGGKYVINTKFRNCVFADCHFGLLTDSSAFTYDVDFYNCTFIGTDLGWAGWFDRPGIRLHDCLVLGPLVHLYANADPNKAFRCYRTKFSNDVTLSPTGTLYALYPLDISSQDNTNVYFEECLFEKVSSGDVSFGQVPDVNGIGPKFHNCSFYMPDAAGGHVNAYGVFSGNRTTFINNQNFPGQAADVPWLGANNLAISTDSFTWSYTAGGVGVAAARYRPNWDGVRWKKVYFW
jgi:hypothetical protein